VYDFGDNWAHTVTVEEIRSGGPDNMFTILDDRGARHPKIAAARPDASTCSTCWPTRPARTTDDAVEWLGADFDPAGQR
jgi:Plasmid pRiA4b ORF-3-like protein